MRLRNLVALGAAAIVLAAPAPAAAKTVFGGINAHRGGSITEGRATGPENSLEAFKNANELGAEVIELDAKRTSDNVPVIMHDATLDRTTNCTGPVRQITAANLAANCRIDTLGTGDKLVPATGATVAIPTLADVLIWARNEGVYLNLEIKNQPTDPDYDPTPGFAQTILSAVDASGIRKERVLIQSFWPANLDEAKGRGFATSFLMLQQGANQQAIDLAVQRGYDVVSPGWPTAGDPKEFVTAAHKAGKPVIPYTIDSAVEIARAFDAGVDGVITNDPTIGLRTRYGPICRSAQTSESRLKRKYQQRLKRYRAERNPARKRKARDAALSARKAYNRARRIRGTTCAKAHV
jgi:glycerophosphoryl diester phosphodiesterase